MTKPKRHSRDNENVGLDPLTKIPRSKLWWDVSRDKKPPMTEAGKLAHKARWAEIYHALSKVWEERGDIEMALYYEERAKEKEV